MNRLGCILSAVVLAAGGCGKVPAVGSSGAVTLLFAGDLMLGRGVEPVATLDPAGLFEDIRFVIGSADVAAANLESPLTTRPHLDPAVHALGADPAGARLMAAAGFDVLGVANNHAGDAGAESVLDSMAAVSAAGMETVGGGADREGALTPVIVERNGLRVAYLAFDATGRGVTAGTRPGIATWDAADAERAVREAERLADVVTVAIHGGIEYLSETDPYLETIAEQLAGWGVDVVWGHGAHVIQPVRTLEHGGHTTVVATSLGNFLFDQVLPGTTTGALLEVVADADGVRAYRVGSVAHEDLRVHFSGWDEPVGDAVLFQQAWWNLVTAPMGTSDPPPPVPGAFPGDVVATGVGDVTGDGNRELVVSFRRPFRETLVNQSYPDVRWTDDEGRSAHLGIYRPDPFQSRWVAGSLPRPVSALAVCDGAISLGFGSFDDAPVQATGAWVWSGFGFWYSAELAGAAVPTCVDIDRDGKAEPAVIARSIDDR